MKIKSFYFRVSGYKNKKQLFLSIPKYVAQELNLNVGDCVGLEIKEVIKDESKRDKN
jgi:hypothetical protein